MHPFGFYCKDVRIAWYWGAFALRLLPWKGNKYYIFWVCLTLVIQHAKRMRPIIMSTEFCPSLQYFSTLPYKRHEFRKKKKLPIINCVFWFSLQLLIVTFIILRETEWDIIINMTFVGPCIVIYFYSKTDQMYNISNLFYFGTTLYMFRTVFPSIIRSLRLYIQHHTIQVLWLLASKRSVYIKMCTFMIFLY